MWLNLHAGRKLFAEIRYVPYFRESDYGCGVSACTVGTSCIFTKKSNNSKCFFDICNAEMAQSLSSLQKSEFLKLIILIFCV
jgi:hypothetical protein